MTYYYFKDSLSFLWYCCFITSWLLFRKVPGIVLSVALALAPQLARVFRCFLGLASHTHSSNKKAVGTETKTKGAITANTCQNEVSQWGGGAEV